MNLITTFIAWIFDPHPVESRRGDEQYLAQSVDICDLERRMRVLDERRMTEPFAHG